MSALLTEHAQPRVAVPAADRLRAPGGRPTLDEVMTSAWEGLAARRPVDCPVCQAPMHSLELPGTGGWCPSCHSTLR